MQKSPNVPILRMRKSPTSGNVPQNSPCIRIKFEAPPQNGSHAFRSASVFAPRLFTQGCSSAPFGKETHPTKIEDFRCSWMHNRWETQKLWLLYSQIKWISSLQVHSYKMRLHPQSLTARPWKWIVRRLLSFWIRNLSGRTVKLPTFFTHGPPWASSRSLGFTTSNAWSTLGPKRVL